MIVGRVYRRRYGKRVQIPRCRATVSEDTADVHWEQSSLGSSWEGRRQQAGS